MPRPRRGRLGVYDTHNRVRQERQEEMTPEQRKLDREIEKAKALQPVSCAPVLGDPQAIDWFGDPDYHHCGYVPKTKPDGRPLPKSGPNAEPAWRWREERGAKGQATLRSEVNRLARLVYKLGHRHSTVELQDGDGYPDDEFWGRHGPKRIVRELKAMEHTWRRGQKQHLRSMLEADQDVGVWFPCCLLAGRVDEELAALAGAKPKGTYARTHRDRPYQPLSWAAVADGALDPD